MPILTDEKRIAELRKKYPNLTHTSWKQLSQIEPRPNVDKHHQDLGNIVCATSSDSDFYALRCNERDGMINFSFPCYDAKGNSSKIFIFEKMKDTYYEHVVSSENFTPIVSEQGDFSGEWVSRDIVKPQSVKIGTKEDILKSTKAKVFTIANMRNFKEKLHDDSFIKMIKNPKTALKTIQTLASAGILKVENCSKQPLSLLSKHAEHREQDSLKYETNNNLSAQQQIALKNQQYQH